MYSRVNPKLKTYRYLRGMSASKGSDKQAAVGPRGSGGTLNMFYSAGEIN